MPAHDVVEICAGAGGQSLGLHLAGFRHRLAVELDATAAQTLALNLARLHEDPDIACDHAPDIVRVGDVADPDVWHPEDYEGVDLLAGGVPCPPFSVAGKQLGAADERDLFAWAVELAGRVRPRAVMLENVRGLASPRFAGYRQAIADRLHELGYWSEWRMLQAADFGVPQLRPRFVLIALRPEVAPYWSWPEEERTDLTVGEVLLDLVSAGGWSGAADWATRRATGIAPTIVGGSKKHGGPDLGPTRAKRAWAELGVDAHGIADAPPPRTAPKSHLPRLTTDMVARLQGWYGGEYRWDFVGRKTSVYRQIGNAFPPPVARALGVQLRRAFAAQGEPVRVAGRHEPHDLVYQILRDADEFVTESRILERAGGLIEAGELRRRVELLDRDFVIFDLEINGERAWRLGDFRAFRGQEDHPRHAVFADRSRLSRIS
ncbi:MAG TPA: DNA (cytosine-5-)-methyltransferase [Mycobacteriales bacterium]|nr:DNA (cytosine-5-)-methyltransferase [Mycobacteriales bacterium]